MQQPPQSDPPANGAPANPQSPSAADGLRVETAGPQPDPPANGAPAALTPPHSPTAADALRVQTAAAAIDAEHQQEASRLGRELTDLAGGERLTPQQWAERAFGEDGTVPKVLRFIAYMQETTDDFEIRDLFGPDGHLHTRYGHSTWDRDLRVHRLRLRHAEDFARVMRGEMTNTEARTLFTELQDADFNRVRAEADKYFVEVQGAKSVSPEVRQALVLRIEAAVGFELVDNERKAVVSWLRQGKTQNQRGSTEAGRANRDVDIDDLDTLKRGVTRAVRALDEITDVKALQVALQGIARAVRIGHGLKRLNWKSWLKEEAGGEEAGGEEAGGDGDGDGEEESPRRRRLA